MLTLVFLLAHTQVDFGTPSAHIGEGHLNFPLDFVPVEEGSVWVLDGKSDQPIRFVDGKNKLLRSFGEQGSGPGQFRRPISLFLFESKVFVYDLGKGALLAFDLEGSLISEHPVVRGSFARFSQGRLIIHSPLGENLFTAYDLEGEIFGSVPGGQGRGGFGPKSLEFVKRFTLGDGSNLYAISPHGGDLEVIDYSLGKLIKALPLGFDFSSVTAKADFSNTGPSQIKIEGGLPIQDIAIHGEQVLMLVQNEKVENEFYLLRFAKDGKLVNRFELLGNYTKIRLHGDSIYLLDQAEAIIDQFPISRIRGLK